MIKKVLLGFLGVVVVGTIAGGAWLYSAVNRDIDEKFAGTCTAFPLVGSAEDIQIDRERGYAYMSVLDRMGTARGEEIDPGQILRLDLTESELSAGAALVDGPELHPHGISLYTDAAGKRTLFLINHPKDRGVGTEKIERYVEESPGRFRHAETYTHPDLTRPNDMVAVGPDQFYVAQDTGQGTGITETKLLYYDGNDWKTVADDIQSGGGINVSADLGTLYIAETNSNSIRVARLDPATGELTETRTIELPGGPDNIDVAEDGSLWVGVHSNLVALVMHFIMGSDAPTQIVRVEPDSGEVEEIYLNKGSEISTGSGGATVGNKLLIGSITARKVLVCERA